MKKTFPSILILGFSTVPFSVFADVPNSITSLASIIVNLLNIGSLLLISASVMAYMGVALFQIWDVSRGKTKRGEATTRLLWGVVIIFFMVSIWGVIQILQYTFLGGPNSQDTNGPIHYSS